MPIFHARRSTFLAYSVGLALALGVAVSAQKPGVQKRHESQDAVGTLPNSYSLEFENDWVRIVRVHYDAKAKLPEHEHPAGIMAFLYLNASDGVFFQHEDGVALRRPPVVPGGIRVTVTPVEHHLVTNEANTPSDFIRVLLKTEFSQVRRPIARMAPSVMEYDHRMVRVSRTNVQPGTTARIEAKNHPVMRIAWVPGRDEWKIAATDGYRFLDKGTTEAFAVTGDVPMQVVAIELRMNLAKPK